MSAQQTLSTDPFVLGQLVAKLLAENKELKEGAKRTIEKNCQLYQENKALKEENKELKKEKDSLVKYLSGNYSEQDQVEQIMKDTYSPEFIEGNTETWQEFGLFD